MRTNAKQVIQRLFNKFEQVKREAPLALGNAGTRYFLEQYAKQSWEGDDWPARAKGNKNKNPLLIGKTRRLKNSVVNSLKMASVSRIKWASNGVPYAAIQNYGGIIHVIERKQTVGFRKKRGTDAYIFASIGASKKKARFTQEFKMKAHNIVIPARKFMGTSKELGKRLKAKFEQLYRRRLR